MMKNKIILIVAAHPDDEILGCGATVARYIEEGYKAYTLILGEGKTSRDKVRDRSKREREIVELHSEIQRANKIIGIQDIYIYDFPDNRFDTVAFLDIVKVVDEIKNKIKPGIIFTHYKHDLNIDHRISYEAVITATRPMQNEPVKEIYSFEILSSTEWQYGNSFSTDTFIDVSQTIDKKINAIKQYKSELQEFPHPRSIKGIKLIAENHGIKVGKKYVEAFETIRRII